MNPTFVKFSTFLYVKPTWLCRWGGEDDELMKRVSEVGIIPHSPDEGSLTDLENM
jgi:hypothetical protein